MNWVCPFCQRHQVVTGAVSHSVVHPLDVGQTRFGDVALRGMAIRCVNVDCNELFLSLSLTDHVWNGRKGDYDFTAIVEGWHLRPRGNSKPQPEYIPKPIVEDYREACLIKDLSPKASATLARRCLQGMIRDFCGIARSRLIDEIGELRKQVDGGTADRAISPDTLDAIDAVRKVGNIGAHMEKDIDLIVEVDPGEAQALIELIELLFEEWYVARHNRRQRVQKIEAMAAEKEAQLAEQKSLKAQQALGAPIEDAASEG
jgi:hypothetical protein